MLGINARTQDLRESLIKVINEAQMPACILDYVLTEILNDVRMQRISEVQKERKAYKDELAATDEKVKATLNTQETPVTQEKPKEG